MSTHRGPGRPRELTRRQIRRVLRWHQRRLAFQRGVGSLRAFSKDSGVPLSIVRRALSQDPTAVLAAQSPRIRGLLVRWVAQRRRFEQYTLTAEALAAELGVSRNTLYDCIRRQGRYQQSPGGASRRIPNVITRRARLSQQATDPEIAARAAALKRWSNPGRAPKEPSAEGGSGGPARRPC